MNKWKYIPYSLYNNKKQYYSIRNIMSYNMRVNIIIGARGYGKTFALKRFCINDFLERNKMFTWVRDTEEAKLKICENNGVKFFADVPLMEIPKFSKGIIKGEQIKINGMHAGDVLPASTFQRYKGNSYQNVYNIVYDEFIRERGRCKKGMTVWETINTFSTIARDRDNVRIFLLANALDKGDPFLEFLGIDIDDYGFYINKEKSICLHYADNSAKFTEKATNGVVGKLVIGTKFEDNLINSKFLQESGLIFEKMPPKARLLFIIESYNQSCRFYTAGGKLYVTSDDDVYQYLNKRYVDKLELATTYKPILSMNNKNAIKEALKNNCIFFESNFLHKFVISIFQ